jgi:phosphoinositide-3-kinase, regulatory subunit 4
LIHPTKGHGRWVMVAAGGEISVWDIEKMVCREVMRPSTFLPKPSKTRPYEAWSPDEENSERILSRFAKDASEDDRLAEPQVRQSTELSDGSPTRKSSHRSTSSPSTYPILAMSIATDFTAGSHADSQNKHAILLTGGADRALRYWDMIRPENSFIVSGPQLQDFEDAPASISSLQSMYKYDVSHPLSLSSGAQITLVQETLNIIEDTTAGSTRSTPKRRADVSRQASHVGTQPGSPSTTSRANASAATAPSMPQATKPPRNTIISASQLLLLKTHLDTITDVAMLRRPYGCVVSVDQGGNVYVFH